VKKQQGLAIFTAERLDSLEALNGDSDRLYATGTGKTSGGVNRRGTGARKESGKAMLQMEGEEQQH
jgi:hypothetical protein